MSLTSVAIIILFLLSFKGALKFVVRGLTCMFMLVANAVANVITWLVAITGSVLYWCVFTTISFTAAIIWPVMFVGLVAAFVWVCSKGVGASVPTSTNFSQDGHSFTMPSRNNVAPVGNKTLPTLSNEVKPGRYE